MTTEAATQRTSLQRASFPRYVIWSVDSIFPSGKILRAAFLVNEETGRTEDLVHTVSHDRGQTWVGERPLRAEAHASR